MFTVTWTYADSVSDVYGSEHTDVSDLDTARSLARDWAAQSLDSAVEVSISQDGITLEVFTSPSA